MNWQRIFTVFEHIGGILAATPFTYNSAWKKNDSSLVTNLDLQLQKQMVTAIQMEFPGHNLIFEEGDRQWFDNSSNYTWVIDPIDGTSNFASGKKEYGSSIGLMRDGEFIAALVSFPAYGETFEGYLERGLLCNGNPFEVARDVPDTKDVILCSRSFPRLGGAFSVRGYNPRFYYCATYSLMRVLKGKASMFLAVNTNLYDVGPMAFLLKLAGHGLFGRNGQPLAFEPRPVKIPFFLAVNSRFRPDEFLTIIGENLNGS